MDELEPSSSVFVYVPDREIFNDIPDML